MDYYNYAHETNDISNSNQNNLSGELENNV